MYKIVDKHIKTLLFNELNISNVKHTWEYTIIKNIIYEYIEYEQGVFLDVLLKKIYKKRKINTSFNAFKKKIVRIINNKLNPFLNTSKKDGLVYIELNDITKRQLLNLISLKQNSNSDLSNCVARYVAEYGSNTKILKDKAILELVKNKMLSYENLKVINELFLYYLTEINNKSILLKKIDRDGYKDDDFLILKYKTRFNDSGRLYEHIDNIDNIFYNASKKYKNAVFLTLTTDPNRFKNLGQSYKQFTQNLNRFFSYLRKKFKKRLPYINVMEFTKSGLLHAHIVIFGVSYLMNSQKISSLWDKYGQGKIIKIYALKEHEGTFIWKRKKPKDCQISDLSCYLSKYLRKAFFSKEELSLYWASNKRFFTYSRQLLKTKENKPKIKRWEYLGVYYNELLDRYGPSGLYYKILEKMTRDKISNYFIYYTPGIV